MHQAFDLNQLSDMFNRNLHLSKKLSPLNGKGCLEDDTKNTPYSNRHTKAAGPGTSRSTLDDKTNSNSAHTPDKLIEEGHVDENFQQFLFEEQKLHEK